MSEIPQPRRGVAGSYTKGENPTARSRRVYCDGTHGLTVNRRTRIRDQERSPIASDLKRALREKAKLSEQCLEQLGERFEALERDILVASFATPPTYVCCSSSGSLHLALGSGKTPCGWSWKRYSHRVVTELEWQKTLKEKPTLVCPRCR